MIFAFTFLWIRVQGNRVPQEKAITMHYCTGTFKEDINIEWVVDCEDPFMGCLVFEVEVKGSGENEDRPRGRSSPTT